MNKFLKILLIVAACIFGAFDAYIVAYFNVYAGAEIAIFHFHRYFGELLFILIMSFPTGVFLALFLYKMYEEIQKRQKIKNKGQSYSPLFILSLVFLVILVVTTFVVLALSPF